MFYYSFDRFICNDTLVISDYLIFKQFLFLVTGTSNVSEDSTTNFNTPECDAQKTLNKRIHNLLYPIFGHTAVSVIIYRVYLYTRSLEKRLVKTNTV